jgi:NADPH2:quinone reductase
MDTPTMLEAIFHPFPKPHVLLQNVSIPVPPPKYLLIKVIVASSNPKDWQHPTSLKRSLNSGDDLAGTVAALGPDVPSSFKVGDRVAAFHPMLTPGGAYAEYALAPATTTFHIPDSLSFEEASTIPLVSATAAVTLFRRQCLPPPWRKRSSQPPSPTLLIIYGASSSLGTFAIKLAALSNIHPIIAIAGSNAAYTSKFLDTTKGDILLDYRIGSSQLIAQVKSHLDSLGLKAHHAFDCISEHESWIPISQMLDPSPVSSIKNILSVVSGSQNYSSPEIPSNVEIIYTYVGSVHTGAYLPHMPKQPAKEDVVGDPAFIENFFKWLEGALRKGEYEGHGFEVVEGGLAGVEEGLRRLRVGEGGEEDGL